MPTDSEKTRFYLRSLLAEVVFQVVHVISLETIQSYIYLRKTFLHLRKTRLHPILQVREALLHLRETGIHSIFKLCKTLFYKGETLMAPFPVLATLVSQPPVHLRHLITQLPYRKEDPGLEKCEDCRKYPYD